MESDVGQVAKTAIGFRPTYAGPGEWHSPRNIKGSAYPLTCLPFQRPHWSKLHVPINFPSQRNQISLKSQTELIQLTSAVK